VNSIFLGLGVPEVVKLQVRISRGVETFFITVPKKFILELGWKKGDMIVVDLVEEKGEKYLKLKKVKL